MNFRLVSVLLILLLIGSVGFGVYELYANQQLSKENDSLKQQLDQIASQLRDAENETRRLNAELNQTQQKIRELEANMTALQKQLEEKREDLQMRTGAITIGLSFLWTPTLKSRMDSFNIRQVIFQLNRIWNQVDIYWFPYHSTIWQVSDEQVTLASSILCPTWVTKATDVYPARDIPIVVVPMLPTEVAGQVAGLACDRKTVLVQAFYTGDPQQASDLIAHELLHVLGLDDVEIDKYLGISDYYWMIQSIPSILRSRLQEAALRFQMPLPDDY